jgi:hypothetical protein
MKMMHGQNEISMNPKLKIFQEKAVTWTGEISESVQG